MGFDIEQSNNYNNNNNNNYNYNNNNVGLVNPKNLPLPPYANYNYNYKNLNKYKIPKNINCFGTHSSFSNELVNYPLQLNSLLSYQELVELIDKVNKIVGQELKIRRNLNIVIFLLLMVLIIPYTLMFLTAQQTNIIVANIIYFSIIMASSVSILIVTKNRVERLDKKLYQEFEEKYRYRGIVVSFKRKNSLLYNVLMKGAVYYPNITLETPPIAPQLYFQPPQPPASNEKQPLL